MQRTPILYNRDARGKVRTWQAMTDGEGRWRTEAGILLGKPIITEWTVAVPKSQDTPEAQAWFECQSAMKKKQDRGYVLSPDLAGRSEYIRPMLAESYDEDKGLDLPERGFWLVQPKFDGFRCIATADGLFSRGGLPIIAAPHIVRALELFFADNPDVVLDGELYNHAYKDRFTDLSSVFTKKKLAQDDIRRSAEVAQLHVYDIIDRETPYEERYERITSIVLDEINHRSIKLAPTFEVREQDHLDALMERFVKADGYEGQMIRNPDAPYQNKRTWDLVKRKCWMDGEFKIADIKPGKGQWSGCAKSIQCLLPDGRTFGAGYVGPKDAAREILANKHRYIGSDTTVMFFRYTPDGKPYQGRTKIIWDGERSL